MKKNQNQLNQEEKYSLFSIVATRRAYEWVEGI